LVFDPAGSSNCVCRISPCQPSDGFRNAKETIHAHRSQDLLDPGAIRDGLIEAVGASVAIPADAGPGRAGERGETGAK